jgi:hypothetical protein
VASATTTVAEICNEALLYVGSGQAINDLDEDSAEARACKVYYAKTRDALLEAFPWKFAGKRSVLALLSGEERVGWAFAYAWPSDCLAPRRIWNGQRTPAAYSRIPFDVESTSTNGNVSGRCIVTDREDAELIYTAQVTTVALFTPLFCETLALSLASKLALILPIKPDVASRLKLEARAAFQTAAAAQLRASQEDVAPPSEYTAYR